MSENAIIAWLDSPPPVDPYAANPLADELDVADPAAFARATAYSGPAPKLFAGGARDHPDVTASGVDGFWLTWLPVGIRHAAAAFPTEVEFFALVEQVAGNPDARIDHPDLDAAEARLRAWSTSECTDTAKATAAATAKATTATGASVQAVTRPAERGRKRMSPLSIDPAELIAMGRRGEFLPPRSTMKRHTPPVLRQRTHTGRTV